LIRPATYNGSDVEYPPRLAANYPVGFSVESNCIEGQTKNSAVVSTFGLT